MNWCQCESPDKSLAEDYGTFQLGQENNDIHFRFVQEKQTLDRTNKTKSVLQILIITYKILHANIILRC